MSKIPIDVDDVLLARARRRLGTKTERDTVNRALTMAAAISADDRARALRWLQDNAEDFLGFGFLAERERSRR
ncbi:type II toxin-antitoxin system VapB family antitoxin [Streptomyces sp. NPDC090025]|uniref:type II toxin-antitoxin system VapB family antitoxin n=1 Tax=Streptomyces sp. NPDC090025 TaxID=3365922 RepID=UPI003836CB5E